MNLFLEKNAILGNINNHKIKNLSKLFHSNNVIKNIIIIISYTYLFTLFPYFVIT